MKSALPFLIVAALVLISLQLTHAGFALDDGWSPVSYLPRQAVDATEACLASDGNRTPPYSPPAIAGGGGILPLRWLKGDIRWKQNPPLSPPAIAGGGGILPLRWLVGDGRWETDGWGVARLEEAPVPVEFSLHSVYPNPFNGQIRLQFGLESAGEVVLRTYDLSGREVDTITSGRYNAGVHRAWWDADGLPSGIHLICLTSGEQSRSVKVVLIR